MSGQERLDELNLETGRFYRLYHEKISRRVRAALGDSLTPIQYLLMGIISEAGPIAMGEVCERVMMQKQQVTSVVNQLEEKGLVTRARQSGNRRVVWLECTPRAFELERQIQGQSKKVLDGLFGELTDQEIERYVEAMRTVNQVLMRLDASGKG